MGLAPIDPNAAASSSGIFGLPNQEEDARVILVPVPFEATVSYGEGAVDGPAAILEGSQQVELFDLETGHPYEAGIFMLPADPRIVQLSEQARAEAQRVIAAPGGPEAGEGAIRAARALVDRASEEVNQRVYDAVRQRLAANKIVGTIGGDHSIAFGAIRAHAEHHGELGILHIDAHADLRHAYQGFRWSHASIMDCVISELPSVRRLTQVAIRDFCPEELDAIGRSNGRIRPWFDVHLARARAGGRLLATFEEIVESLPPKVYVSFDIDGLDPKLCPHTGTPVPGGLDLNEVSMLLERVVLTNRTIVGFDLTEVSPGAGRDPWDGNVGARALYKLIGWTLKSQTAR